MARKKKSLKSKVASYFSEPFKVVKKNIIPDPRYPKLSHNNSAIVCDLAFIFVDIRDSSRIHQDFDEETAASIYKAFHEINVHIIEHNHGKVRAFDGDRVMGVFGKQGRASQAVASAMQILGAVRNILNEEIEEGISIGIGIDVGEALITKVGKGRDPNNNDLIWVGTPCNLASHLSRYGENSIFITQDVYESLKDTWIYDSDGNNMWKNSKFRIEGFEDLQIVKSNYWAEL